MSQNTGARHDESLKIGVAFIDKEHLGLFEQLNRLIANPDALPDSEIFSEVLDKLGKEIGKHFDHEEEFIRSCGIPEHHASEHIKAHNEILEQYTELNLKLMGHDALNQTEVLVLIKGWIVDHLKKYDFQLRSYLGGSRSGSAA